MKMLNTRAKSIRALSTLLLLSLSLTTVNASARPSVSAHKQTTNEHHCAEQPQLSRTGQITAGPESHPGNCYFILGPWKTICQIAITAVANATNEADPIIKSNVICDESLLYQAETKLSELQPVKLNHSISLFAQTPYNGTAYVYIKNADRVLITNSYVQDLPPIPNQKVVAPFVSHKGQVRLFNCTFKNNSVNGRAGALLIGGDESLSLSKCNFEGNSGEVGAVVQIGSTVSSFDQVKFENNRGTIVGGIMADDKAVVFSSETSFFNNKVGKEDASLYFSGEVTVSMYRASLFGNPPKFDWAGNSPDTAESDQRVQHRVHRVKGNVIFRQSSTGYLRECYFEKHGSLGAPLMIMDDAYVQINDGSFVGNRGITGGAVYIKTSRTISIYIQNTTFTNNGALKGGALHIHNASKLIINDCSFKYNRATKGGAIMISAYESRLKRKSAASKSVVEISNSMFARNYVTVNGGAINVKHATLKVSHTIFSRNRVREYGSCIYGRKTKSVTLIRSLFRGNEAEESGGCVYLSKSRGLHSVASVFSGNRAEKNGGAVYVTDGPIVKIDKSFLENNIASDESGGALFLEKVEKLIAARTMMKNNRAGKNGGGIDVTDFKKVILADVELFENAANTSGQALHASEGLLASFKDVPGSDTAEKRKLYVFEDVKRVIYPTKNRTK